MVCFCLVDLKGDWIYQGDLCSQLSEVADTEYGSKTLVLEIPLLPSPNLPPSKTQASAQKVFLQAAWKQERRVDRCSD